MPIGAKSIEGLDPFEEGPEFHVIGVMRTKPGTKSTFSKKNYQLYLVLFVIRKR
jgi:hypothetical protein